MIAIQQTNCYSMKIKKIIIAHKDPLRQLQLATGVSILDCNVSKTFSSGIRTLRYILRNKPDIAILQSKLDGISAFDIVKEIASKSSHTKVIIIFENPTYENLFMARSLNVQGCFCETEAQKEILSIVQAVLSGGERYCKYLRGDEKQMDTLRNFKKLSNQEIKIMSLFGFYKNTKKVAEKLEYSSKKIETYTELIASKLNINPCEHVLTEWAENNQKLIKTLAL